MNYLQTSGTATAYRRSGHIRINNPIPGTGTPNITFEEQDVVVKADGSMNVMTAPSGPAGVSITFDPAAEVDLLDPSTGAKIGSFTHAQFEAMLFSLYFKASGDRDAAEVAAQEKAQAVAAQQAWEAANPIPSISFASPYSFALVQGAVSANRAQSTLMGGNYGAITYTSSDESVATVDAEGVITTHGVGNCKITADQAAVEGANRGAQASFELAVTALPVPQLSAAFSKIANLSVGSSATNAVISTLQGAPYPAIEYTSSDPEVATVASNGVVTGVAPGTATITATQEPVQGINAQGQLEFDVQVVPEPTPAPAA